LSKAERISTNTLVVIVVLVFNVWWIVTGLLYGRLPPEDYASPWREFVYWITIVGLILIPICAREKRGGFLAAMVLGIVTLAVEAYLAPVKISQGQIGGTFFGITQILIIIFAYRAHRKL